MGKRRKVPEDLMGTILGEGYGVSGEELTLPEHRAAGDVLSWEEQSERVGVAFNLSKQLAAELDRLRGELRLEGDVHPSRSEIAEAALRIAVEDARERGQGSELARRLGGRLSDGASDSDVAGGTSARSVDESGFIVETVYDANGRVVDEDVVASLSDLPVEMEYVDEAGRLVSQAEDELGNVFEWITDDESNTLRARILRSASRIAR